jgi:stage V sporulation protein AE
MDYLKSFFVGGLICVLGQILIDKTKITPARTLVAFVVLGSILSSFNIYQKLIEFAGCGASVPISGFGNAVIEGVKKDINEFGIIGIFSGGLKACAAGIGAAIIFSLVASLVFKSHNK